MITFKRLLSVSLLVFAFTLSSWAQGTLTFEDVMKFEDISDATISDNGEWIAYSVWPDRGDGEVRVRSTDGNTLHTITLGSDPELTSDGSWVVAYRQPPLSEQLKEKKEKALRGAVLLNTANGQASGIDSVRSFSISNDGKWIFMRHYPAADVKKAGSDHPMLGARATLRNLDTGESTEYPFVHAAAFDSTSRYLAISRVDTSGDENGLYYLDLSDDTVTLNPVSSEDKGVFSNLAWDDTHRRLAFTSATLDEDQKAGPASIHLWDPQENESRRLVDAEEANEGWKLENRNDLEWTDDGQRLFFGFLWGEFQQSSEEAENEDSSEVAIYDREEILTDKGVDVWHWDDPLIKPHEKNTWDQRKNELYRAVYHMDTDHWVQLADREIPDVGISQNPDHLLGSSDMPYRKLMTWEWFFNDYYVVDLESGDRKKVADKLSFGAQLSPDGNFVLFFKDLEWHLYDVENNTYRNLTGDMEVPFHDVDHDRPSDVPPYGIGGWVENDQAVLIYDKYDIWQFPTDGGEPKRITGGEGTERQIQFRIEETKDDRRFFSNGEEILLEAFSERMKNFGFYTATIGESGVGERLNDLKKYQFVDRADEEGTLLYTRQTYSEYPNLWISRDLRFRRPTRLSELHLDLTSKYAWGSAELVEWTEMDSGTPLQGVLIKPGNYEEGKKYPVLIYYYHTFSDRLYDFNEPRTNHRPVFAQYASDGYAVFLPDIRFETGTPGFSATKSLLPGVQMLVDRGIVDPDGIGLHGHSWSGYQTAFVITQTDIFDAAVAGAPVSNMTSAYSGIRWGSGLARQFQYERTQSRIGGSLWEYPERYLENSPVFYADRINTPLLLQFGDEDGAVPWYQGIELYLAMRRLGKDAIFLQYHGEPHHLQKYPNKLDYAIKMKQYFDHYLKGEPAPEWITDGVPYRGEK